MNLSLSRLVTQQEAKGLNFFIMTREHYDDLEWDIEDIPIGSSTPDHFCELSYRATAVCNNCGNILQGVAQYWSRSEDMFNAWLERIDYDYCECELEEELDEEDDYEDETIL